MARAQNTFKSKGNMTTIYNTYSKREISLKKGIILVLKPKKVNHFTRKEKGIYIEHQCQH